MKNQVIVLLAGAIAFSLACAPVEAPVEPVDLEAVKAELIEKDKAWAAAYASAENSTDAFMAQFEDGARMLAPDVPLAVGKDAIRAVSEQLEALPGIELVWSAEAADVSEGGDFGYTTGSYYMNLDGPDGTPIRIDGKYLTVWRRQADGSWKATADMFNPNGPPTPIEE